jgi:hypothetical protein
MKSCVLCIHHGSDECLVCEDFSQFIVLDAITRTRKAGLMPCLCDTLYVNSPIGVAVLKINPLCMLHGTR